MTAMEPSFRATNRGLRGYLGLHSPRETRMSNPNQNPGQQNQTPGQKPGQQNQTPGQKPGQQQGGGQKPGQQQQDPNR
jgi:hypothetical protein